MMAIGGLSESGESTFWRTFVGDEEGKEGRRLLIVDFDIAPYRFTVDSDRRSDLDR
jgi:hypothetical protein